MVFCQLMEDAPQPSRGIRHPLRFAIERVLDYNQMVELIGEGRGVVQRIFDRERLTLWIHSGDGGSDAATQDQTKNDCVRQ